MGKHSSARVSSPKSKRRHVIRALATMRLFSISIVLGAPVEPEVWQRIVRPASRHRYRKSVASLA